VNPTLPKVWTLRPMPRKTPTAKGTKNPPWRNASLAKTAARKLPPTPTETWMTKRGRASPRGISGRPS